MPAILVASHGPFTWGPDADAAVDNAVALETIGETALRTLMLKRDVDLASFLLERRISRKQGPGAYYGQEKR